MMQNVIKNWAKLSQATRSLPKGSRALLASSISSLTPRIETVGFDELFAQLNDELKAKKIIHLTIDTYWGDEWFCPDKTTAIAIPFWLADERLKKIERSIVGFVEGETEEEFMRLMRHEAGHCVEHAYRLSRRQDWRDVFGNPKVKYDPDSVKTVPNHPNYVVNLSGGYAQTHPEEDFAETFAVWLDPDSEWKKRYRKSQIAIRKLNFVDQLMNEVSTKKPHAISKQKICNARRMRRTLESYYCDRLRYLN
jgi:hypothetical protein